MNDSRVDVSRVGEALSNKDRLAVLRVLVEKPGQNVRQVLVATGYPVTAMQTVRRHLASLERAGLVRHEVVNKVHIYYPNAEGIGAAVETLTSLGRNEE